MGAGIYIALPDGRPAMEITSGLRAFSHCGDFNVSSAGFSKSFGITDLTGGDKFLIPKDGAYAFELDRGVETYYISGFSASGGTATISIGGENAYADRITSFSGSVFEIARASSGQGILVADSTDFASLTTNSTLMSCLFVANISFYGTYTLPVLGVPFGCWSNDGVSVEFDGYNTLICTNTNTSDVGDTYGSVNMDLAIFSNSPPTPGDGVTIINPYGQCVFSTSQRPLVIKGFASLTNSYQYIGDAFFPILRCGFETRAIPAYKELRYKGISMFNGHVRGNTGSRIVRYEIGNRPNFCMGMPLPYLPRIY
ncbi:DUF6453 family protein [Escherichia coli]|uniref:DUF6453 family protein n=1 Tax=Escherichia coli TaxID=562 RepID=UPI0018C5AB91|nr:DUF6453 family protein [Escherichia coli]